MLFAPGTFRRSLEESRLLAAYGVLASHGDAWLDSSIARHMTRPHAEAQNDETLSLVSLSCFYFIRLPNRTISCSRTSVCSLTAPWKCCPLVLAFCAAPQPPSAHEASAGTSYPTRTRVRGLCAKAASPPLHRLQRRKESSRWRR